MRVCIRLHDHPKSQKSRLDIPTNRCRISEPIYSNTLSFNQRINGLLYGPLWREHGPEALDADLAALYGVETKALNQAVRRNIERFPDDFMFQLTSDEMENLRSQTVTSSSWGGRRTRRSLFTRVFAVWFTV
jgi:hypothetical protein